MQTVCRRLSLSFLAGAWLLMPPAWAQQPSPVVPSASDPQSYVKFGIENGMKGDFKAAISAFDEALKIDPKFAPAYENRGKALFFQNKNNEALADYTRAIELNPNYGDAYYDRGVVKALKGDFDGAIDDFNHTIALDPKQAKALYNRGHAKYFKGDLQGAISDISQAIPLDPNFPYSYYIRGLVRHALDDKTGTDSDFRRAADGGEADAALWVWIIDVEAGQRATANDDLSALLNKYSPNPTNNWIAQVGQFLLGKITAETLIAEAQTGDPTEGHPAKAYFYIGISKRLLGDTKGAQDAFLKVVAPENRSFEEYVEAQRELSLLPRP